MEKQKSSKLDTMYKIITADWCSYCKKAKALLQSKNLSYEEIDISDATDLMQQYGFKSIPQIFKDDVLIPGGYNGLEKYLNGTKEI